MMSCLLPKAIAFSPEQEGGEFTAISIFSAQIDPPISKEKSPHHITPDPQSTHWKEALTLQQARAQ